MKSQFKKIKLMQLEKKLVNICNELFQNSEFKKIKLVQLEKELKLAKVCK